MAHVLVIFDKYEEDSIDCVVGPFTDIAASIDWERKHLPADKVGYRRVINEELLDPNDGYLDVTQRYERRKK